MKQVEQQLALLQLQNEDLVQQQRKDKAELSLLQMREREIGAEIHDQIQAQVEVLRSKMEAETVSQMQAVR